MNQHYTTKILNLLSTYLKRKITFWQFFDWERPLQSDHNFTLKLRGIKYTLFLLVVQISFGNI